MTAAQPVPYLVRLTLFWALITAAIGDMGDVWRYFYLFTLANLCVAGTVYFFWNRRRQARLESGEPVQPQKAKPKARAYPQFMTNLAKGWFGSIYTGAISLVIYIAMLKMKVGIIFFVSILIHELGHYWCAKYYGLQPQLPKFIPFLGAYVLVPNENLDTVKKAWFALWGPLAGSSCLVVLSICFLITGDRDFLTGAFFGWVFKFDAIDAVATF